MGYENLNRTFGATQGAMREGDISDDADAVQRAFVHIGQTRAFTLNKGSISYNHNMPETYRQGISRRRAPAIPPRWPPPRPAR